MSGKQPFREVSPRIKRAEFLPQTPKRDTSSKHCHQRSSTVTFLRHPDNCKSYHRHRQKKGPASSVSVFTDKEGTNTGI